MSKSKNLRIMISSRCNDLFDGKTLSVIRKEIKQEIEDAQVFGSPVFEVWINEDAPPAPGSEDSWEHCLTQVKDCDLLLVLSNGNAGWGRTGTEIGICHAELMTGLATSPGKVRLLSIGNVIGGSDDEKDRNKLFQSYVAQQNLFRGATVGTILELKNLSKATVRDALVELAQLGVRESRKGKFSSGEALEWARFDFAKRSKVMLSVLRDAFLGQKRAASHAADISLELAGQRVLFCLHAIPAAMSVPSAKEMVGQPFLRDHLLAKELSKKLVGPVHVIACQRSATETQATKLLGFADATVVMAPFGIFVADDVQKVQFAFIANCRDDTTTRHGIQRFLEWLEQTGEAVLLTKRANSRTKIIKAIAAEAHS
jgi:hypothetical protein